ncbi:MAG: hypothetical protein DWQ47_16230 [Acidobacteria bacterium]|nr:MAG: hypothetical protein DWQ32_03630 [Acidobacteriota bacterium]REK02398.1 MAG: hypothetical protein DWQ38_08505 [Acidobacteriota bacterium]REK13800.1 MAG: hypothetical protein DWQ43_09320 [Acidobacteriota bacterium]REK41794.1 MAG: hypothetical protein DWQ47_16230 [Acidobacteriota bacterium]
MYRRPKFLEILLEVREQMSRDADYDVDLFAELVRSGKITDGHQPHEVNRNGSNATNGKVDRNRFNGGS